MKRHVHTFDELKRVGQRYYNDTNFCTVVAVAVAAQVAFGKARALLAKEGRKDRTGAYDFQYINAARQLGCRVEPVEGFAWQRMAFSKAVRRLPADGIYWVQTTRHITCVVNGTPVDWMTTGRRHHVQQVWRLTREFEALPDITYETH